MKNNAVIYLRVACVTQGEGSHNQMNQEQLCRTYCRRIGLNVLRIFTDAGVSGHTRNRPEFQRMLTFCRTRGNNVGYVVVQDLSRIARNNRDQVETIKSLRLSGVRLRSTYESHIDETAVGGLAARMLAAFKQYFSDPRSEK
jgi:site-specific DNA recombinase